MLTEDARGQLILGLDSLQSRVGAKNTQQIREEFEDMFFGNTNFISDILELWPMDASQQIARGFIARAIRRLKVPSNLSLDPSFDALIERRVDTFIEANSLAKWMRRFISLAAISAVVVGGVVSWGVLWQLFSSVRAAQEQAYSQIKAVADDIEKQKTKLLDDINDAKKGIEVNVENFGVMVDKKVEDRAKAEANKVEKELSDLFSKTAGNIKDIDTHIEQLTSKLSKSDADEAEFERKFREQIARKEEEIQANVAVQMDTVAQVSIQNLTSRLSGIGEKIQATAGQLFDAQQTRLKYWLTVEMNSTTTAEQSVLRDFASLQKQVDDAHTQAIATIDSSVNSAKKKLDETAEGALADIPKSIAALGTSLNELKTALGESQGDLGGLSAAVEQLKDQTGKFNILNKAIDENQTLTIPFINPALTVIKHTFYVAIAAFILSLLGAVLVAWLTARRASRSPGTPLVVNSPSGGH